MTSKPTIGVIGLGDMGAAYSINLAKSGFPSVGFDLQPEKLEQVSQKGVTPAKDIADLVEKSDIIITSLPSSKAFLSVAESEILPRVRPNQLVIETGTTVSSAFIELSKKFGERDATLIDCPVSGGKYGAENRSLKIFAGGSVQALEKARPVLVAIGGDSMIYHCGETGSGEAMKGVNQLKMAFENAMYLEILAYAQNNGLSLEQIEEIWPDSWDDRIRNVAAEVLKGNGSNISVKFRELPYFTDDASNRGFQLPMTAALHEFCSKGKYSFFDDHRDAPSFWHELTRPASNT